MKEMRPPPGETGEAAALRAFYFAGSLDGRLHHPPYPLTGKLPGSLVASYSNGEWAIVLTYYEAGDRECGSETLVSHFGEPLWRMACTGWYERDALACRRAALYDTWCKNEFHGGRGATGFPHHGYVYTNKCSSRYPEDRLNYVGGTEEVLDPHRNVRGRYVFSSSLLRPLR